MALFGETLVGRFNRQIARLHSMKGGAPAPQVTPEISHSITLENDRPELMWLGGTVLFADTINLGPTAGQTSHTGISNPVGSGAIATVWALLMNETGANARILLSLRNTIAHDAVSSVRASDGRSFPANFAPGLVMFQRTGATQANTVLSADLPISTSLIVPAPFVLSPGMDLFTTPAAINLTSAISVWGWVRALESSEVT